MLNGSTIAHVTSFSHSKLLTCKKQAPLTFVKLTSGSRIAHPSDTLPGPVAGPNRAPRRLPLVLTWAETARAPRAAQPQRGPPPGRPQFNDERAHDRSYQYRRARRTQSSRHAPGNPLGMHRRTNVETWKSSHCGPGRLVSRGHLFYECRLQMGG